MQLARAVPQATDLEVGVVAPGPLPAAPGTEEMFLSLYRRVHDRALDHAERFLSPSEAEDAVSQAVLEVWAEWKKLRPEQRSAAYFYAAVHHNVLDALKESAPLVSLEDAESQLARLAVLAIDTPERGTTVSDVVDLVVAGMPPRRRQVFLLVRDLRYTYKEAAEILGLSEGTVNTHMWRASEDLNAALAQHGFRIGGGGPARLEPETGGDHNV